MTTNPWNDPMERRINTPLELAIQNQIDRFSIAIDVIDRIPDLRVAGATRSVP